MNSIRLDFNNDDAKYFKRRSVNFAEIMIYYGYKIINTSKSHPNKIDNEIRKAFDSDFSTFIKTYKIIST